MALNPALMKLIKDAKKAHSKTSRSVRLKEGKTTLRLVCKPDGTDLFADLGVHWIKTASGEGAKPVAVVGCAEVVHGVACQCCTAIEKAVPTVVDDETLKIVKEWKAKKSVLVNALVRSGTDASEDPQVFELTPTTFGGMMGQIEEYAASDIDILDFKAGMDFVVERIGKGLDTKYTVMPAPKSKPVPADTVTKLIDLKTYIETEFFRGDEPKALRAIGAMTGISVGGLIAAGPRPSLLTGPGATVADASVEDAKLGATEDAAVAEAEVVAELEAAEISEEPPFDADIAKHDAITEEMGLVTSEEEAAELEAAEAAAKLAKLKAAALKRAADARIAAAAKPAPAAPKVAAAAATLKPAAAKPAPAAAPATTKKPADDLSAAVSQEEINAMLAELDGV